MGHSTGGDPRVWTTRLLLLLGTLRVGHSGRVGTLRSLTRTLSGLSRLRTLIRPWTSGSIALLLLLPLSQRLLREVDRLRLGHGVLRFE